MTQEEYDAVNAPGNHPWPAPPCPPRPNAVEQKAANGTKEGKTPRTEDEVVALIRERGRMGRAKYGKTMDLVDLPPAAWARHLQEEMVDGLKYARRVERLLALVERARVIMRRDLRTLSAQEWLKDLEKEFAP